MTFDDSPFPKQRTKPHNNEFSLQRTLSLLLVFVLGFLVSELEVHRVLGLAAERVPNIVVGPAIALTSRPTPSPAPTIAPPALDAARQAVLRAREALVRRAPREDFRFFERTMPQVGGEVHVLGTKYAHAIATRSAFTIGVVGTSNAACHDNELADCFTQLFRDGVADVLAPLGIGAVLRNHAMGALNSIVPSLCLDTMVGDDLDLLLIEYLMTDAGMPCAPATHEMLARRALRMPKQPVPHFVEIEGGRRDFKTTPFPPQTSELDGHYRDQNAGYFRPLRETYADFGLHHMQMLDGLWTVDDVSDWRYETLFITHHPGPAGHRYLADQLLYYHYAAILVALELVAEAPAAFLTPRRRPLPPTPIFCGDWCKSDEAPLCLTSFQPRYRRERELMAQRESVAYVGNATECLTLAAELVPPGTHEWRRVLPPNERLNEVRGYVDFKLTWQAAAGAGDRKFVVTVPRGGVGAVVVCRAPPPWDRTEPGRANLTSSADVRFTIDAAVVLPRDAGAAPPINTCGSRFSVTCVLLGESLSEGSHTLSIEPLSENLIDVSHIIAV
jgi:hypothetical protein